MYKVLSTIEKGAKGLRIVAKLSYYKVKYGKRLILGKGIHFRKGFIINISKDGRLKIGDGTFFNNYCSINCHNKIVIGKNNLFGEGVKIYDHNHIFNKKSANMKKDYKDYPIIIGDRNWFGSNVIIIGKAEVGDNNVFGANAIINSKYDSDNLAKMAENMEIKKINYRDSLNEK